ncbi:hypothetical protein GCM10020001_036210 [Nonomuraea salmonea]
MSTAAVATAAIGTTLTRRRGGTVAGCPEGPAAPGRAVAPGGQDVAPPTAGGRSAFGQGVALPVRDGQVRLTRSVMSATASPKATGCPRHAVATAASTSPIAGRCSGPFDRARSAEALSAGGKAVVSTAFRNTRSASTSARSFPYGCRPVAAYTTTSAQPYTSAAGPVGPPAYSSGLTHPGEPTTWPVAVRAVPSRARAMPKSTSRGPSGDSITLEGFRSRCTTPAACTAVSASASPAARPYSSSPRSGPCSATCSVRVRPAMYSVASQGCAASAPSARMRTQ